MEQIKYNDKLMILLSRTNSWNWKLHPNDEKVNRLLNRQQAFLTYIGNDDRQVLSKLVKTLTHKVGLHQSKIKPAKYLRNTCKWELEIEGLPTYAVDVISKLDVLSVYEWDAEMTQQIVLIPFD